MAATTDALGLLHAAVAKSLAADLEAAALIGDPGVRAAVVEKARAQAITFLKNNSITADASNNDELSGLKAKLEAARKKTPAPSVLTEALAAFEQMNPGLPQ